MLPLCSLLFALSAWADEPFQPSLVSAPEWATAPMPDDPRWRPVTAASGHLDRRMVGRRAPQAFSPTVARMDVHWAMVERGIEPLPLEPEFERRAFDHLMAAGTLALRDLGREVTRRHEGLSYTQAALGRVAKPRLVTTGHDRSGTRRSADAGATLRVRDLDDGDHLPLVDAALHARLRSGPHRLEASALLVRGLWVVRARHRVSRDLWVFASVQSRPGHIEPDLVRLSTLTPLPSGLELRSWGWVRAPGGELDWRGGLSLQTRWGGRAATASVR